MRVEQLKWTPSSGFSIVETSDKIASPQLVIFFADSGLVESTDPYQVIRERYPHANIIGSTTSGEILTDEIYEESVVISAIEFEKTQVQTASASLEEGQSSYDKGIQLAKDLHNDDLRYVLILSEGSHVNGSELVRGMTSILGDKIPLTGGLAGDGVRFEKTAVSCNSPCIENNIAAIGFYGDSIRVGHGSMGGWDPFGPIREITHSEGNILHELDGKPALELYKKYLGEEADNLPGSALLFPLMVRSNDHDDVGLVRTILSVDEDDQTMTLAGDIPQGYTSQLMCANFDRLIDGAGEAAKIADFNVIDTRKFALLISCVGRKIVLGQRTAEEVETVYDVLGDQTVQMGFYSYGEISPHVELGNCELHNQTMTVTLFAEV